MDNKLNITSAQYVSNQDGDNTSIRIVLDNETNRHYSVPLGAVGNRKYDEIMRQVEAGTLTIEDAD